MSLKATLSIDNSEFKKGLKDAENQAKTSMDKMSKSTKEANSSLSTMTNTLNGVTTVAKGGLGGVTSVLAKMGPYGAAAAAAIALIGTAVVGVIKGVSTLAHGLRDTVKTANSVNMSANAYISLQHACAKAGIEMSKVLMLINKIDYAVIHAEAGEKKYADAFYKLGIAWEDLEKMSPEKRLMAINDAMRELKESGKSIPKEMFDIFGKRDMQTLNKMQQQKDFNKLIAEAGALGYTIPDSMLQAAVRYAEVTGGTAARFKAMVASIEEMEKLTNGLASMWKSISDRIANSTGYVDKAYQEDFEGIANVAERLFKITPEKISDKDKRAILTARYADSMPDNANDRFGGDFYKYLDYVNNLNKEELEKEFVAQTKRIDFKNLPEAFRQVYFKLVEKIDSRFRADDQSTWVQAREQTPEDKAAKRRRLEESHANTEARALNDQLKRNQEYYDNAITKNKKLIDVEKEIKKIELNLKTVLDDKNAKLDDEVKHQLRLNAALVNQKALESEILKINENKNRSFDSFYSSMLGQMGANKNIVDQMFSGIRSLMGPDFDLKKNNLLYSLNRQFLQLHNPRETAESYQDYMKRIQDLMKNPYKVYSSVESFAITNPEDFWKSFKGIADSFSHNEIDAVFSDENVEMLKKTEEEYNKFAKKVKADPISINLDFNGQTNESNTKNYESIKAALEGFKNQEIKDAQETSWISQARAQRAQLQTRLEGYTEEGDSTRRSKVREEFDEIDAKIKKYEAERNRLEELLNKAQGLLGNAKFTDEIKKANEEAYNHEYLSNMFKFRSSKEDTEREIKLVEAQTKKEQDVVNEIEKQNILKKAGIVLTERNLKNYDDILDDLIQINKQLEEAKNKKVLTEKIEASTDNNKLSKNILKENWAEVETLEKINHLRAIGVQITQENINKYDALLKKLHAEDAEQRRLNMISQLQSGNDSVRYSLMELQGKGRQAASLKAVNDAEQSLRRSLTTEEKNAVASLAELQYKLSNWKAPELKDDTVYTNDLAKRGGFNTSVVVEQNDTAKRQLASLMRLESIGQEIIKQEQRNNDILNN